jgi:OOP family OmpA-OmpF porin
MKENERLQGRLFDARQMTNLLMARNEELEAKLGDVEKEKSTVAQRLEVLKRVREKYDQVEKMFTAEEALFFREGNNIRIRLTGLSFLSGKSAIDSKYYPFLGKILKAVKLFPDATITVEGHTDSYGSDKQNWQLSYDRAENVMLYIVENMDMDKSRIEAIGFGESRPIATNETEQGRAKNRRIAVVIHPKLEEEF